MKQKKQKHDTRYKKKHEQKHRKRSRRRIIQNTDTKLIRRETLSRRGNERRFVFIPFQVSFSPCLERARLVFSMFFHGFRFLTHSHRHTVSPPSTEELHSYATPFSTHSTTPRAKDTKWMNRKKWVKEKQIFNRVKKEYEKERKETNRNSYRRIAKCGVCAMRRRNSKKAKTN